MQSYQVYNEKIYDLLGENKREYRFLNSDLKVRLNGDGSYGVEGLKKVEVREWKVAEELM
jgi:hypothetical protein